MEKNLSTTFSELAAINVGSHIEKKNGFNYLSWSWAVDQLLRNDPSATWEYKEPVKFGDTVMVFCSITVFGITRTMQLPVIDNRNKAIANPDAMAINTAMMRCLVKAIALTGLGLYLYSGEDLPLEDSEKVTEATEIASDNLYQAYKDSALQGYQCLTDHHASIKPSAAKTAFWTKNGVALKQAAKLADQEVTA